MKKPVVVSGELIERVLYLLETGRIAAARAELQDEMRRRKQTKRSEIDAFLARLKEQARRKG